MITGIYNIPNVLQRNKNQNPFRIGAKREKHDHAIILY